MIVRLHIYFILDNPLNDIPRPIVLCDHFCFSCHSESPLLRFPSLSLDSMFTVIPSPLHMDCIKPCTVYPLSVVILKMPLALKL